MNPESVHPTPAPDEGAGTEAPATAAQAPDPDITAILAAERVANDYHP